jgi:RNA polymerase sigma factor (sigma-70 family)
MPHTGLSAAVTRAGRAAVRSAGDARSDGRLLAAFLADRDADAFAELVARFAPMVFAVCRRVTGHQQDAEDAFQATFVVLARKAARVSPREAVGAWLHGVAVRTAREARSVAAKRLARETPTARPPDPARPGPDFDDTGAVLHEELAALPDKFRTLLVLCDLEARPQVEVAARLGLPVGTVYSRLAAARKLLADRLRTRGVARSAAGLSAALAGVGRAAVPAGLPARAVAAAVSAGPVPAAVAALTHGVLRAMLLNRLKAAAPAAVLAAGLLAAGLLAASAAPSPPTANTPTVPAAQPPQPAAQPPAPKSAGPGRLLVWTETKFVFYTPDGKEDGDLAPHPEERALLAEPALSPDGKWVAFAVNEYPPTDEEGNLRRHLYYRDVDGKTPGVKLELTAAAISWEPDGKALIVTEMPPFKQVKDSGFTVWRVDVATQEKKKLDLPKHAIACAVMPGGKGFVAALGDFDAMKMYLALVSRDGKDVTKLCELRMEGPEPRPSPDGTKILFQDMDPDEKPEKDMPPLPRLYVYDLKAKARTRLAEVPLNALPMGYSWSPDGKKIAYTWRQVHPGVPPAVNADNMNDPKLRTPTESHLVVCDPTGKNPKTLRTVKSESATRITLGKLDWR